MSKLDHPMGTKVPQNAAARWAMASLSLSMLLSSLGTSIANVALPTLTQSFDASFQSVQWVVLAYLLAITSTIVGVGRLGDVVGRRRLLLVGIAVFTVASVLCSAAPGLGWLIVARALQGIGAAIMMALTLALVGDAIPKERTGSVMGLLGTMSAVGTALGPTLGGLLIAVGGWQAIFLIKLPLGVAALLLALRALVTAVVMATLVVGPFYLASAFALDSAGVGLVMSIGPLVAALSGMPAGRLVDRLGAQRMTIAGLTAMTLDAFALPALSASVGLPGYVGALAVITAGYALFQAANNTAVMTGSSADQRGLVSGLLNLSRNLGLITGASLMGAAFALGTGTSDFTALAPQAAASGLAAAFAIAAGFVLAALLIAVRSTVATRRAVNLHTD